MKIVERRAFTEEALQIEEREKEREREIAGGGGGGGNPNKKYHAIEIDYSPFFFVVETTRRVS